MDKELTACMICQEQIKVGHHAYLVRKFGSFQVSGVVHTEHVEKASDHLDILRESFVDAMTLTRVAHTRLGFFTEVAPIYVEMALKKLLGG